MKESLVFDIGSVLKSNDAMMGNIALKSAFSLGNAKPSGLLFAELIEVICCNETVSKNVAFDVYYLFVYTVDYDASVKVEFPNNFKVLVDLLEKMSDVEDWTKDKYRLFISLRCYLYYLLSNYDKKKESVLFGLLNKMDKRSREKLILRAIEYVVQLWKKMYCLYNEDEFVRMMLMEGLRFIEILLDVSAQMDVGVRKIEYVLEDAELNVVNCFVQNFQLPVGRMEYAKLRQGTGRKEKHQKQDWAFWNGVALLHQNEVYRDTKVPADSKTRNRGYLQDELVNQVLSEVPKSKCFELMQQMVLNHLST